MADQAPLERLLEDASRIPAAPGVALELARLCGESDSSIDRLAAILQRDPTLTAKILRVANSAYFASRRPIADLPEAIVRLGLRRVQIMAMAFCIMEATGPSSGSASRFDYTYFWSHALVTATFADMVAQIRRMKLGAEAMVAGLLQDIGVLVIQTCMPEKYRTVLALRANSQEELHVVESRRLGFTHAQAGEFLLRRWQIPEQVCLVVGNHHQPEVVSSAGQDVMELARVCHLGAAVAKVLAGNRDNARSLVEAGDLAQEHFAMPHSEFHALLTKLRASLASSAEIFDVQLEPVMVKRLDAAIRDCIADCTLQIDGLSPPGSAGH